jgi:hypothetical protein
VPIVSGGGGGGGGLPLTGGTLTGPLVIAPTSNTADVLTLTLPAGASGHNNMWLRATQADEPANTLNIDGFGDILLQTNASDTGVIQISNAGSGALGCILDPNGNLGPRLNPLISGALPTATLASGTGGQLSTARDVDSVTPFTGDATNNAATCKIELSPDNVTYTTLNTVSIAAALNLTGALDQNINVAVPAGWYVKLTAVHGTLGTTTYY